MEKIIALVIRYKNFKQKIKLVKEYERKYKIEDLDGYLYMVRRDENV